MTTASGVQGGREVNRAPALRIAPPPVAQLIKEPGLEAFSPGRAAAHDGHGRLAEGERAF